MGAENHQPTQKCTFCSPPPPSSSSSSSSQLSLRSPLRSCVVSHLSLLLSSCHSLAVELQHHPVAPLEIAVSRRSPATVVATLPNDPPLQKDSHSPRPPALVFVCPLRSTGTGCLKCFSRQRREPQLFNAEKAISTFFAIAFCFTFSLVQQHYLLAGCLRLFSRFVMISLAHSLN